MKVDDIPVVGETESAPADSSRAPRRWGIAVGATMVVVVAGLSVAIGSEPDPTPTLPDPAPVTTTTAALGESPRMADSTLTWSPVSGLEDVIRLHEVLELDDTHLAVATEAAGIGVYSSEDGASWERKAGLGDRSRAWPTAAVIDNRAVVVANGFTRRRTRANPMMWTSTDGESWSNRNLPPLDPAWPDSVANGLASLQGQIVISGWSVPTPDFSNVVEELDPGLQSLIEDGQAALFLRARSLVVRLDPVGPTIHSEPLTEAEVEALTPAQPARPIQWTGSEGSSMTASQPDMVATLLGTLDNGDVLGLIDGLAVSPDGENWTRSPAGIEPGSESIWGDLVVGSSLGMTDLRYWDPGTGDYGSIIPIGIFSAQDEILDVAAGGSGVAAVAGSMQFVRPETESVHLADVEGGNIVLNSDLQIEMTREEGTDYTVDSWTEEAELAGDNLVFMIGGTVFEVPIDRWLAAVAGFMGQNRRSLPFSDFVVVHSPDGHNWSSTPWIDITGRPAIDPVVYATDEYLLAVDHDRSDEPIRGAWIGRPTG